MDVPKPEEKLGIDEFKDLIITQKPTILISAYDLFHTHEILEMYSSEFVSSHSLILLLYLIVFYNVETGSTGFPIACS